MVESTRLSIVIALSAEKVVALHMLKNGFIGTKDLIVITGNECIAHYETAPGKKQHFCKVCASPIFSSNAQFPDRLRLRLGILDSDIVERHISHNFVSSKANWDDLDAILPRYDDHEPSRSARK
jgi:hypothetical protein